MIYYFIMTVPGTCPRIKAVTLSCIVWTLILSTSSAQAPSRAVFSVNAARSRIELTVFRAGLLKMIGHDHAILARSFSGEVRFNPANVEDSSVQLIIESGSLIVLDAHGVSENHRKEIQANMEGVQVLNIQEFPQIMFRSTEVRRAATCGGDLTLRGELRLHGVQKEIVFPVQVMQEKNLLRVTGRAEINQTDFGIKPIKAAAGGLRVKDRMDVKFEILAERAN